jgi:hypothetical protein
MTGALQVGKRAHQKLTQKHFENSKQNAYLYAIVLL